MAHMGKCRANHGKMMGKYGKFEGNQLNKYGWHDTLGQHLESMGNDGKLTRKSWFTGMTFGNFLGTSLKECVAEIIIGMMIGVMEITWNNFIHHPNHHPNNDLDLLEEHDARFWFSFFIWGPNKLVVMDCVWALHPPFWGRSAGKVAEPINFERTFNLDFVTFQCYIHWMPKDYWLDWLVVWNIFYFPYIGNSNPSSLTIINYHH